MKASHVRDAVLIAAVLAIAVAAILPSSPPAPAGGGKAAAPGPARSSAAPAASPAAPAAKASAPAEGTAFPIAAGMRWTYHVEGPKALVPDNRWTMEVRALPAAGAPGEMVVGFGDERAVRPFWIEGGALRFAGLPFAEPLELRGAEPTAIGGHLLPAGRNLFEGAVWSQSCGRAGVHEMTNPRNEVALVEVSGVQTDRALAGERAEIIVPAGAFAARRIDWIGRVELAAGARPVLDPLTAAPFRTEILWVSEIAGIVRRRVEHAHPEQAVVVFDLVSYTPPPPAGGV